MKSVNVLGDVQNYIAKKDRPALYQLFYSLADRNEKEIIGRLFTSCYSLKIFLLPDGLLLTNKEER
jgi:hypothetical protein